MWALLMLGCTEPSSREGAEDPAECSDGFDNDGDGALDCDDPDCSDDCTDDTDDTDEDSSPPDSPADDTGPNEHPNVPPEYRDMWDTEGCTDSEGELHSVAYIVAAGSTDATGELSLTERWYWFYKADGWDGDCIDVLTHKGPALPEMPDGASESEEAYLVETTKGSGGCDTNYLEVWDHPEASSWSEGEDWQSVFVFDTLTPSGELNWESMMLVFFGLAQDGQLLELEMNYARGEFSPDTEVLAPPAHYTWVTSFCLED
jgi:hypothetical protein